MRQIKQQIIILDKQGYTRPEIVKLLKCSKSLVCYHLSTGQKEKARIRLNKRRKANPLIQKLASFLTVSKIRRVRQPKYNTKLLLKLKLETFFKEKNKYMKPTFTVDDVLNKIGKNPVCYLTGESIDISKPRTYHFDHIIPRTRGGENTLDNLGLATKQANQAKFNMTHDEFLKFCKQVVDYNKL